MASSDRIDFNLTGHDWAPNKFTRKNIIRRITCDGSSGDLVVYDALIIQKLNPGKEVQHYHIDFYYLIQANPDIANKAVDFSIDVGSSCCQSTWSSYSIPFVNYINNEYLTLYIRKDTKQIVLSTLGDWENFYANIYINVYVPRSR